MRQTSSPVGLRDRCPAPARSSGRQATRNRPPMRRRQSAKRRQPRSRRAPEPMQLGHRHRPPGRAIELHRPALWSRRPHLAAPPQCARPPPPRPGHAWRARRATVRRLPEAGINRCRPPCVPDATVSHWAPPGRCRAGWRQPRQSLRSRLRMSPSPRWRIPAQSSRAAWLLRSYHRPPRPAPAIEICSRPWSANAQTPHS